VEKKRGDGEGGAGLRKKMGSEFRKESLSLSRAPQRAEEKSGAGPERTRGAGPAPHGQRVEAGAGWS